MRILTTVVAGLALMATGVAQEQKNQIRKVPIEYTSPSSGADMFRSYCAACHGNDGKGTGPAASALKKAPADLTLLTRKNGGKFPAVAIGNTIKGDASGPGAHGSRDMPMWGDIFRNVSAGSMGVELRVSNLTDYIKGLQEK